MRVQKSWGYENIVINTSKYAGKELTVFKTPINFPKGVCSSIHYHKNKTETFYGLEGKLGLEIFNSEKLGEREEPVIDELRLPVCIEITKGTTVTLPPLVPHRFWAITDRAIFIEFSTHDDPEDSYRLIRSGVPDLSKVYNQNLITIGGFS